MFSFIEIQVRTFEIKLKLERKKAIIVTAIIIGFGNILVSLGFGPLKGITIPWPSFGGVEHYGFYDWFDCFTGYLLLPLGCLLTCFFVWRVWGWKGYEKELTVDGRDGKLTTWNKCLTVFIVPLFMIVVLLNVFGFIK